MIGQVAGSNGDVEMAPLRGSIQRASFTGLKKDGRYTVKVNFVLCVQYQISTLHNLHITSTISTISTQVRTVVNGKTICQVAAEIKEDAENMPTETKEAPM